MWHSVASGFSSSEDPLLLSDVVPNSWANVLAFLAFVFPGDDLALLGVPVGSSPQFAASGALAFLEDRVVGPSSRP